MSYRVLGLALSVLLPLSASAQLIDFETDPAGGLPVDDSPLATPYNLTGGGTVEFFFDANSNNIRDAGDFNPLFEAAGQDGTDGFVNSATGVNDDAANPFDAQLGNFFLRQPVNGTVPPPFIIDYNTPLTITDLGGEIWDIDGSTALGTEQWLVEVLSATNVTLASQLSPLGVDNTMDAMPWVFGFSGLPSGVDKVRITFVGSKTMGLGLAFNNFTPVTPEPMSFGAIMMLAAVTRRRRR